MTDVIRAMILPKLGAVRRSGDGYAARCPNHDDTKPSLTVSPGDTQPVVLTCHTGCHPDDILAALGLEWRQLCAPRTEQPADIDWLPCSDQGHQKVAEYQYRDSGGSFVFAVTRCNHKCFACWRPDPTSKTGRRWKLKTPDGNTVGDGLVYRLPEILSELRKEMPRNIWICEGEKDADRLWNIGQPATCNRGGSGVGWNDQHSQWLSGADVVIVADKDRAGWEHAEQVANSLMAVADSIEIVAAEHGKDASDHLDAGGTLTSFITIAVPLPASTNVPGCDDCTNEGGE